MMARAEYMESPYSDDAAERARLHRTYYAQFVTPETITAVVRAIGVKRLLASTDPHMNDIPLRMWDALVPWLPGSERFTEAGDYYTKSGGVCLAKEAARQWVEAQQASKE